MRSIQHPSDLPWCVLPRYSSRRKQFDGVPESGHADKHEGYIVYLWPRRDPRRHLTFNRATTDLFFPPLSPDEIYTDYLYCLATVQSIDAHLP